MRVKLFPNFTRHHLITHTNFLCESSDDFHFLDTNGEWYVHAQIKKTSQNTISHQERINPCFAFLQLPWDADMFLHFRSYTKRSRNARGNIIRRNRSVPKIILEWLRWVEGLYGGVIIWPSCAPAEIPYQPKSKPRFLSSLFRKRYEHCMNKKEVILKSVVFFQSSSVIWSLMTNIKKYRWIRAALIE